MAQTQSVSTITQFELSNQILDTDLFEKVKLTTSAKIVLIVLCRYYPRIYPCQKTIAKKAGLSIRSVINAISELKQKGLLLVECNYSNTYKFTNLFFELAEISHSTSKTCTMHGEKFALHEQINNKNIKKASKNNFSTYRKPVEGIKILPANETIRKYEKDKQTASSPLDMPRDKQIEYYNKLPEFAKNGLFAREIKKRWNL